MSEADQQVLQGLVEKYGIEVVRKHLRRQPLGIPVKGVTYNRLQIYKLKGQEGLYYAVGAGRNRKFVRATEFEEVLKTLITV